MNMVIVMMYNGDMHFAQSCDFTLPGFVKLVGKTAHFKNLLKSEGRKAEGGVSIAETEFRVIAMKEVRMVDCIKHEALDANLKDLYQKVFLGNILIPGSAGII